LSRIQVGRVLFPTSLQFSPEKEEERNVLKNVTNELIGFNTDDLHAEESVLTSFIHTELTIDIKEIDLIVIRTNKLDQLRNSRPCCRCVNFMKDFISRYNIKINNIFYSVQDKIETTTFDELATSPHQHVPKGMRGLTGYVKK